MVYTNLGKLNTVPCMCTAALSRTASKMTGYEVNVFRRITGVYSHDQ